VFVCVPCLSLTPDHLLVFTGAVTAAVARVDEALRPGRPAAVPLTGRVNPLIKLIGSLLGVLLFFACSCPFITFTAIVMVVLFAHEACVRRRKRAFTDRLRALEHARCAFLKRVSDGLGDGAAPPCAICLDELPAGLGFGGAPTERGVELLRCGHCFHQTCLRSWARAEPQSLAGVSCPLCRRRGAQVEGGAACPSSERSPLFALGSSIAPSPAPSVSSARDAAQANEVWSFAIARLAEDYADVRGVSRWGRSLVLGPHPTEAWLAGYTEHAAEEAAEAHAVHLARGGGSSSGGGGWGLGSCVGGGGAGGSW